MTLCVSLRVMLEFVHKKLLISPLLMGAIVVGRVALVRDCMDIRLLVLCEYEYAPNLHSNTLIPVMA